MAIEIKTMCEKANRQKRRLPRKKLRNCKG